MKIYLEDENNQVIEALASKTRIKILKFIAKEPRNIKDIASFLGISSAIVTRHIQKLEEANLISSSHLPGKRGLMKICTLKTNEITISINKPNKRKPLSSLSIKIGDYIDYSVSPTCGLASKDNLIGYVDDHRYFSHPEHTNASILWFSNGYVTYRIPSFIFSSVLEEINITMEICSEYPGYKEDYLSDLTFLINNEKIGTYTMPGDFGKTKGVLTPKWWNLGTSHGLLKQLIINEEGTFIDGNRISNYRLNELLKVSNKDIEFTLAVYKDSTNCGGLNLFGKDFGNHPIDLEITVY